MNEVILSGLGILLALCGMTVLIFRRVSPIIVGPLAALLVTVMSGLPVLDSVTGTYVQGVGSFFVSYFMIFLLGNILGSLYQISGAAAKIGETVVRWFGAKNCMVACLISAASTALSSSSPSIPSRSSSLRRRTCPPTCCRVLCAAACGPLR